MGNSTGAEILGNAFNALAAVGGPVAVEEARKLFLTTRSIDCTHDEMECDDALIKLGLAQKVEYGAGAAGIVYLTYEEIEAGISYLDRQEAAEEKAALIDLLAAEAAQ